MLCIDFNRKLVQLFKVPNFKHVKLLVGNQCKNLHMCEPLLHMYVHVMSLAVPDLHIQGSLQAIHVMLDKPQLELIKGLVEMNLGETIEEFEKPSTVIRDPIAQVSATKRHYVISRETFHPHCVMLVSSSSFPHF